MFCYKGSMQFLILVYVNFAFQLDSHPQQPKSEQLEKLEVFKAMLERLITFLQVSKNITTPSFKEKLGSYEKQIVSFLNPSRFRRTIPNLQLGQPPVPQLQSHENQLNPFMFAQSNISFYIRSFSTWRKCFSSFIVPDIMRW